MKMHFWLRDMSVASKLAYVQLFALGAVLGLAGVLLATSLRDSLETRSEQDLRDRNTLVVHLVDSYRESREDAAVQISGAFGVSLPSQFELDPSHSVKLGSVDTPSLRSGSVTWNGNFPAVDRYTAATGAVATLFARTGDDFVRVKKCLIIAP